MAIEELGLPGLILMENAARGVAEVALSLRNLAPGPIVVACGPGNNGGDGFAVARHLTNEGLAVGMLVVPAPGDYAAGSDAAINLEASRAMGIPLVTAAALTPASLIVDALFGTGLDREVREPYAGLIRRINATGAPVLAIDIPSGLDADSGEVLGAAVVARHTATMVAPKTGFARAQGRKHVGRLHVVGIGTPPELLDRVLELQGATEEASGAT